MIKFVNALHLFFIILAGCWLLSGIDLARTISPSKVGATWTGDEGEGWVLVLFIGYGLWFIVGTDYKSAAA